MPLVLVEELIASPVDQVWDVIVDVESYPRIMEPVRKVEVLSRADEEVTTEWEVELKGSVLKWVEREVHDRESWHISYEQVSGDLEQFGGYWHLTTVDDGHTRAVLCVEFEIGIPMLKDMLDPVASRALEQNSRLMLRSIGDIAATPVAVAGRDE
ncbi:SRPBCC family protein [Actinosynnema sp. NPDC023587]|uniref:type II toxin-antitoxin system RatA family toxin n=1 Tax=Actinosynnema sp. NPDC023587 TaxID=3154695 RepID=UPI00340F30CD